MFLSLVYELSFWLLTFLAVPGVFYQRFVKGKYTQSLPQRFGLGFPSIKKEQRKLIWIHAVSVGETRAIVSLAKLFKEKYPSCLLLISSITETGHAEAKRSLSFADYHVYLPLDSYFIVKPIVERLKPDLLLISEADLWFRFLKTAKEQGASIVLVNGKVSERSAARFKQFTFFSQPLFNLFDQIFVQNTAYQKRFIDFKVSEKKISVTGNLKFDCDYPIMDENEHQSLREDFHLQNNDLVLVIASTHYPEESKIIDALDDLLKIHPQLKIILVPRHPERFEEVARLLEARGILFHRYSQKNQSKVKKRFILVDAMGLLLKCYQIANFAIVGGSFTERVGGHNILEPCAYGIPVMFGPYMFSQPELLNLVTNYNAGKQVSLSELSSVLNDLIENSAKRLEMSKNGLRLTKDAKGASEKTFNYLKGPFI